MPTGDHKFRQRFNRAADVAAASRLGRWKVQTAGEIRPADCPDEVCVATHDKLIAMDDIEREDDQAMTPMTPLWSRP
jgi:hypothetical protein